MKADKIYKILISLILFSSISIIAQTKEFRKIDNNAFRAGEKLTFDVKYGFVTAGVAEMSIPRVRKISGRDVFHITFKVNSVSAFDPFFKVRDRYETFMDTNALIPWRFEQHIREGSFSRDYSAFFDHRRGKAKTSDGWFEIPENVNDIVSAFYLTRTFNYDTMKVGDRVHLNNFFGNKTNQLDVVFHGRDNVTVAAGKFNCVIIEPLVVEGGLFKSEGNILIWLTDDENHMPVKVQTKIVIGSLNAELTGYEGVANKIY